MFLDHGAGTIANGPRNYEPAGDSVPKMFNAFNGLGIMVRCCPCAHLLLDCTAMSAGISGQNRGLIIRQGIHVQLCNNVPVGVL